MGLPGGSEGKTSPPGGGGASANNEENPSQQQWGREGRRAWKEAIRYARGVAAPPCPATSPLAARPARRSDRAPPWPSRGPRGQGLGAAGSCRPQQNFQSILSVGALGGPRRAGNCSRTYFKHQCNGLWPMEG